MEGMINLHWFPLTLIILFVLANLYMIFKHRKGIWHNMNFMAGSWIEKKDKMDQKIINKLCEDKKNE